MRFTIRFMDYVKAVDWMIEHRNLHPVMDVELLDAHDGQPLTKVYVIERDKLGEQEDE